MQLVVVNVSAKDKSGKPIEGLKASDFTVTEDGKPQKISVFEFQRLEEAAAPPLAEAPPSLQQRPHSTADVPAVIKTPIKTEIAPPGRAR